jgi:hypothetical protein
LLLRFGFDLFLAFGASFVDTIPAFAFTAAFGFISFFYVQRFRHGDIPPWRWKVHNLTKFHFEWLISWLSKFHTYTLGILQGAVRWGFPVDCRRQPFSSAGSATKRDSAGAVTGPTEFCVAACRRSGGHGARPLPAATYLSPKRLIADLAAADFHVTGFAAGGVDFQPGVFQIFPVAVADGTETDGHLPHLGVRVFDQQLGLATIGAHERFGFHEFPSLFLRGVADLPRRFSIVVPPAGKENKSLYFKIL